MKKLCLFMAAAMLICLLAACGGTDEIAQTDILYAVFNAQTIQEYSIEYTGAKKNAEELAAELTELTGLDFTITVSETDDGLIVDWAADSTLVSGPDSREQKEEFIFYDYDTMSWFMMDSLWRTVTKNLGVENIYYTMDGGKTLTLDKMSPSVTIPSDVPYMGSEFYLANSNLRGDDDGTPGTQASYQGFWEYPDGKYLEISGEEWNLYADDGTTLLDHGPTNYENEAVYLMNEDGSSGGGRAHFDDDGNLVESGNILTFRGHSAGELPKG